MKILLAVDDSHYSRYAAEEAINVAFNSRAEVSILGLSRGNGAAPSGDLAQAMGAFRAQFLEHQPPEDNPYAPRRTSARWVQLSPGVWEEMLVLQGAQKNLRTMVRKGDSSQVLEEDAADDYDLIVLGCGSHGRNLGGSVGPLMKIIEDARASVLLVKEAQAIHKIVCCLDRSEVPHSSLEMINQMAAIHGADLELLGITREGWLRTEVDSTLNGLSDYFDSAWDKVPMGFKEHGELRDFVSREARPDLLVMWRGQKSLMKRLFPPKWFAELVASSQSSILILR